MGLGRQLAEGTESAWSPGLATWRQLERRPPIQSSPRPTTRVKRGQVAIAVAARGELQGGNSEMLVAPMTGGDTMAIT